MPKFRDITGEKFGRWMVLAYEETKYADHFWKCKCDCGTVKIVQGSTIKNGRSKSCGCLSRERVTKHGMEGTRIYNTWAQMLARCNNLKSTSYKHYGAKGIKVCERWHDFVNFYADMGDKPEGQTLDRIDNSKGYEPGNVRWATWKQQNRNKPITKRLVWNGELLPMARIAELAGVPRKKFENRIRQGMPVEDAVKNIRYNRWNTPAKAVS